MKLSLTKQNEIKDEISSFINSGGLEKKNVIPVLLKIQDQLVLKDNMPFIMNLISVINDITGKKAKLMVGAEKNGSVWCGVVIPRDLRNVTDQTQYLIHDLEYEFVSVA